jgi:hypothetical protein
MILAKYSTIRLKLHYEIYLNSSGNTPPAKWTKPSMQLFCGILDSVNNTPKTHNKLNYSFLYTTITTKIAV